MRMMQWPPLLLLYWLACFAATHLPLHQGGPMLPHLDKVVHFGMYGILGFLMALHWPMRKVLTIVTVYAVFDELTQPFVGRDCDIIDFLCDILGAGAGMYLSTRWLAKLGRANLNISKPGG